MLGIVASMSQTDILALFVGNGSCMLKAGLLVTLHLVRVPFGLSAGP